VKKLADTSSIEIREEVDTEYVLSEIEHTTSKSKIEHTNDLCQKLSKQIIDVII
jgi:hypothetical protein